jgi:hypothetical protein
MQTNAKYTKYTTPKFFYEKYENNSKLWTNNQAASEEEPANQPTGSGSACCKTLIDRSDDFSEYAQCTQPGLFLPRALRTSHLKRRGS